MAKKVKSNPSREPSNFSSPAIHDKRRAAIQRYWDTHPERKKALSEKMKVSKLSFNNPKFNPRGTLGPRDPEETVSAPPPPETPTAPTNSEPVTVPTTPTLAPPTTVRIGSGIPPPDYKSEYLAAPRMPTDATGATNAEEKKKLWQPRDPTPEEASSLVEAFVRLELKGFDGLATVTDWDGWHHESSEMDPDRVIWKYALKRVKFDPGLLMVAIAVFEIMEREGVRYSSFSKEMKARKRAQMPQDDEANRTPEIPEGATAYDG